MMREQGIKQRFVIWNDVEQNYFHFDCTVGLFRVDQIEGTQLSVEYFV